MAIILISDIPTIYVYMSSDFSNVSRYILDCTDGGFVGSDVG